ncbi:transporter substrate-binding domain-containing protein [Acidovorax sp. NCPPB 4044]|uniref:transporter substrate-binding domain-containing protein n=1 Tax=Acidovorax sp. NCPPB 4044 TaxID=2940490 RepID=UPI002302B39F|nr:transporter substrate-binding domain-containing protein [Acidovorax sp. NCPPB 4044]MDA8520156.1 transporter substrate-binding domain-containing protein [Acidovorax sp. NCPPB 4044]
MKIGKLISSLAVLGLLSLGATVRADQLAEIKAKGTLTCGVVGTLEPFAYQDAATREVVGYDVDICKAVAAKMGLNAEPKVVSLEARIPELTQSRVDVLAAVLGYNPTRAEQITFSKAYFVSNQSIAVKRGSFKHRDDLSGKRVATIKGSSNIPLMQKVVPTAKLVSYDDGPSAFTALVQRKVDGYVLSESLMRRFISKLGTSADIEVLSPPVGREYWGLGLRKGEPALEKAVNDALDELERSGEAQKLFDKWMGPATIYQMKRDFTIEQIKG